MIEENIKAIGQRFLKTENQFGMGINENYSSTALP